LMNRGPRSSRRHLLNEARLNRAIMPPPPTAIHRRSKQEPEQGGMGGESPYFHDQTRSRFASPKPLSKSRR
jgi:hypothetical protein